MTHATMKAERQSTTVSARMPPSRIFTTVTGSTAPSFPHIVPPMGSLAKIRPIRSASNNGSCSCEEAPSHSQNLQTQEQQRSAHAPDNEQCAVCMYTGMATCTGLSLYFLKIASEETTLPKNRRFLYLCSAGWAVTGVYRWYLG